MKKLSIAILLFISNFAWGLDLATVIIPQASVSFNNTNSITSGAKPYTVAQTVTAGGIGQVAYAVTLATPVASTDAFVTTVTYGGASMTSCGNRLTLTHHTIEVFYKINPATGSNNLVVDGDSNTFGAYTNLVSFNNVDPANPCANFNSISLGNCAAVQAITITTTARDATLTAITTGTSGNLTSPTATDKTQDGWTSAGSANFASDHALASGSSVTHNWGLDGGTPHCIIYGFDIKALP